MAGRGEGMEAEEFLLLALYRIVYGKCRGRLEEFYGTEPPERVRADPLAGLHIDPASLSHEGREVVAEAADDAIEGRRPRW